MPKNTKPRGMRSPEQVLNSVGKWVNSKFAGMNVGKNTNLSDIGVFKLGRKNKTHTSPIAYNKFNDGHDNPARIRHAATKIAHSLDHMAHVSEEHNV